MKGYKIKYKILSHDSSIGIVTAYVEKKCFSEFHITSGPVMDTQPNFVVMIGSFPEDKDAGVQKKTC